MMLPFSSIETFYSFNSALKKLHGDEDKETSQASRKTHRLYIALGIAAIT